MTKIIVWINVNKLNIYCITEIIEEPCDGSPAEKNPLTGQEYMCSKSGDRSCPANSYCHILEGQMYGRCCKQGNFFWLFIVPRHGEAIGGDIEMLGVHASVRHKAC